MTPEEKEAARRLVMERQRERLETMARHDQRLAHSTKREPVMPHSRTPELRIKSTGPGFLSLLALLFIGLRLGGVIEWSWWLVLSPLWLPPAAVIAGCLVVIAACLVVGAFGGVVKHFRDRGNRRAV